MADRLKFYTDEHGAGAVTEGLRRSGVDVLTAQEAGMHPADDSAHLQLALAGQRIIFKQDADFLRAHPKKISHCGIVYAPQHTSVSYIIQGLMLLYEVLPPDDMRDHVEFLGFLIAMNQNAAF